jgi:F-type H+-transporting ATPase subunit delta
MNRSIIVSRYARSLVKYVGESGNGAQVCAEAEALLKVLASVPDLRRMTTAADDVVSPAARIKLLEGALGNRMTPELGHFLSLLNQNGRMTLLEDILRVFVEMYFREQGIRRARLTVVTEPSDQLLERLRGLVRQTTGCDARIMVTVDPSLVGGFVFDLDDYLLDASIKRQLEKIREQFIERNRRIV